MLMFVWDKLQCLGVRSLLYASEYVQSSVGTVKQPVGVRLCMVFCGTSVCPLTTELSFC